MSRAPYVGIHVASGERRATAADIVASVQREIAGGGLPAGSRLPPVRALERQLGLSKNTAQAAYDELVARGLVEAREREGMFVLAATKFASHVPIVRPPAPAVVAPRCRAEGDDRPVDRLPRPGPPADRADRGVRALGAARADAELLRRARLP